MVDMKLHLLLPNDPIMTMCGLITLPEAKVASKDPTRTNCGNCLKRYENNENWYEKNYKP